MSRITRAELDRAMQAVDDYRADETIHDIAHRMGEPPCHIEKWLTSLGALKRCEHCGIILADGEREVCDVCRAVLAGGSWLGNVPLSGPEAPDVPDVVCIKEIFGYA